MTRLDIFLPTWFLASLFWPTDLGNSYVDLGLAAAPLIIVIGYVLAGRWQAVPITIVGGLVVLAALWPGDRDPFWISALLAFFILASAAILLFMPVPNLSKTTGPFSVGFRKFAVAGERELLVHAWYPAKPNDRKSGRAFHTDVEALALARGAKIVGMPSIFNNHLRLARTAAVQGAKPEPTAKALVVFNHGGGMYPTQNTSLMQELASHGFLVASIGRPEASLGLVWPDKRRSNIDVEMVRSLTGSDADLEVQGRYFLSRNRADQAAALEKLRAHDESPITQMCRVWTKDSIEVVDQILDPKRRPDGLPEVAGAKVIYSGMSLGGAVATACCHLDERAIGGVNLDGFNWCLEHAGEPVRQPFLQLYSDPELLRAQIAQRLSLEVTHTKSNPDVVYINDPFLDSSRKDHVSIAFVGLSHMAFSDMPLSTRFGSAAWMGLGQKAGSLSVQAINGLTKEFCLNVAGNRAATELSELAAALKSKRRIY